MLTSLAPLLAAEKRAPFLQKPEDWVAVGLLVAAMLGGAWLLHLAKRWWARPAAADRTAEELTDYRAMFDRGEITEAEYNRLRDRVAGRVKRPASAPAAGPAPGEPPAAPPA